MVGAMVLFLWMISLGVSFAQEENDETIQKAKQAYKYGEQLFNEGNYPEAIKAFQRAYDMTNRYQLLFNLALSHQFSANLEQARYYFEEYQRLAPSEQWNEAQQRIDNIDAILENKEVQETEEVVEEQPNDAYSTLPKWVSPVMWSVGTVGIASGLYFGIQSQTSAKQAVEYCQGDLCTGSAEASLSSARTSALIADVAWGVGLTALGGALWFQVSPKSSLSISAQSFSVKGVF